MSLKNNLIIRQSMRWPIAIMIILVLALALVVLTTLNFWKDHSLPPLLPAVEKIIIPLDEPQRDALLKDIFVGLCAINAPEGMDYMEIGAQIVLNKFDYVKRTLAAGEVKSEHLFDEPSNHYKDRSPLYIDYSKALSAFPCKNLDHSDCATQALVKIEDIFTLLEDQDHKVLLKRYADIQRLPHYTSHIYGTSDFLYTLGYRPHLSTLRSAQAITVFSTNDIDQTLTILNGEITFLKRILSSEQIIIETIFTIQSLYTTYHTLSSLLDQPQLQPYLDDPRLLSALTPLNHEEQKAMVGTFIGERKWQLYAFSLEPHDVWTLEEAASDDEPNWFNHLLKEVKTFFAPPNYNHNATLNMLYQIWEPTIQRASLTMEELSLLSTHNELEPLGELRRRAFEQYLASDEHCSQNRAIPCNEIGEEIIESTLDNMSPYLNSFYDLQSYITLVNTKYEMIRAGIRADEIDAFLERDPMAVNPLTQKPFTWDSKTHTLSTEWISSWLPSGARGGWPDDTEAPPMPRNAVTLTPSP